jgi:hypothetical protein
MTSTHRLRACVTVSLVLILGACGQAPKPRTPAEVRAELERLLPPATRDRAGWASDFQAAFSALKVQPDTSNLCAALAVTEQESGFSPDPSVPGLGRIALAEIDRRAAKINVPRFIVHAALGLRSPDGQTYQQRLSAVRTERELSEMFEDMIGSVPLGSRLLANANPVHTGGPMQVSIPFAESFSRSHEYPYPVAGSIRHEVFTRRGGVYFGVAHLLAYPASYDKALYRFADFNAGFYASRNAAFQKAASIASGESIALDGDLVRYRSAGKGVGATESAVRSIAWQLEMDDAGIHKELQLGSSNRFEKSELYRRVFELAEERSRKPLARAILPRITLESPKITRKLTTEWFATRVEQRYRRCLARVGP